MTDSVAKSCAPSLAGKADTGCLNSRCRSKANDCGQLLSTRGKRANVPLAQGDSYSCPSPARYNGGHFGTAVPPGTGAS